MELEAAAQPGLRDGPRARWSARKVAVVVLGLAVSAFFGWIAFQGISLEAVWESLAAANYWWLLPCVALTLLTGWIRAIRWRLLFSDRDTVSTGSAFAAINIGLMFNTVLPSRAGEVPRIFALRRTSGLSAFEVGATIVIERILDVFSVAAIGLALYAFLPHPPWVHVLGFVCLGVVGVVVVLIGAVVVFRGRLPGLLEGLLRRLPLVSDERAKSAREAVAAGSKVLVRPSRLALVVAVSLVIWGVAGLSGLVLLPAFGIPADTLAPWLILVANSFAVAIPSGPATIGVYEASVQASLVVFGVSASTALSFAVVFHAVNVVPVILIGLIASWWVGRQPQRARASAEPA